MNRENGILRTIREISVVAERKTYFFPFHCSFFRENVRAYVENTRRMDLSALIYMKVGQTREIRRKLNFRKKSSRVVFTTDLLYARAVMWKYYLCNKSLIF